MNKLMGDNDENLYTNVKSFRSDVAKISAIIINGVWIHLNENLVGGRAVSMVVMWLQKAMNCLILLSNSICVIAKL